MRNQAVREGVWLGKARIFEYPRFLLHVQPRSSALAHAPYMGAIFSGGPGPVPLVLYGATGRNAGRINGAYLPTTTIYNGKVLYRKEGDHDTWLRYSADTEDWIVSSTDRMAANSGCGWCHCTEKGCYSPLQPKKWRVWKGTTWEDQVSLPGVFFVQPVCLRAGQDVPAPMCVLVVSGVYSGFLLCPCGSLPKAVSLKLNIDAPAPRDTAQTGNSRGTDPHCK